MSPSAATNAAHYVAQDVFVERTQIITTIASALYKSFWPIEYEDARRTFKAGRYFRDDCGPWLGRAVGYKVPTTTHPDEGDKGPTFLTSAGSFTGGNLQIHNLQVQFSYRPGDMVLGHFGKFFHRVSAWSGTKAPGTLGQVMSQHNLTPGRVFLVLFNKTDTAMRLKDKEAGWARQTAFGAQEFV
ncbi:hypothetical protein BDZ89DRAFT_965696 [Hymenopellis radicata]|nr:hypothetical protein BDZ89DRAFT_965696 [Hymenopellis radicata]